MPDPTLPLDPAVKTLTIGLVSYLREYLSKLRPDRVRDEIKDADVFWLSSVEAILTDSGFSLPCPPAAGAPAPPTEVRRLLVDENAWRDADNDEPEISPEASARVHELYGRWIEERRRWAAGERANELLRAQYASLDKLRREAANRSDTHELVLGAGLLTAVKDGTWSVRRHLLVCDVTITADTASDMLQVALPSTPFWRTEDRDFLDSSDGFLVSRSGPAAPEAPLLGESLRNWLDEWRRRCWDKAIAFDIDRWTPQDEDGSDAELTFTPALILRPRSQNGLSRVYEAIGAELADPRRPAPVGLANLVAPAATVRPPGLSMSGLFPLPSNREQRRVLENLRADSAVVVQGPRGTGKTHTIANLICALLADGQRVLITSQKDQALRVLRDQLPEEIRKLCVLLTGMRRTGADELNDSLIALSDLLSTVDQAQLEQRIGNLQRRRRELDGQIRNLTAELRAGRMQEYVPHPSGADGVQRTLAETAQFIVDGRVTHGWIDPLPYGAPTQAPLTDVESSNLVTLLRADTAERTERREQEIPGPDDLPAPHRVTAAIAAVAEGHRILGAAADDNAWAVTELDDDGLNQIGGLLDTVSQALAGCGLSDNVAGWDADDWRTRCVEALLRRRDTAYWNTLLDDAVTAIEHEPALAATTDREVDVPAGPGITVSPRRLLHQAVALRRYLSTGRRITRLIRPRPVLRASDLLASCTVNGLPPENARDLDAVIITLRAEIAVADTAEAWAETGAKLSSGTLRRRLAQLKDIAAAVAAIRRLLAARDTIEQLLRKQHIRYTINSGDRWDLIVRIAHAVPQLRQARQEARRLAEYEEILTPWAHRYKAAPELPQMLAALRKRDPETFAVLSDELDRARSEQRAGRTLLDLAQRLAKAHPTLADDLHADPHDTHWDLRFADLGRAWAWGYGHQWYENHRDVGAERIQQRVLDEAEQRLQVITAELAGCQAQMQCLQRTTPAERRALQEYKSAIGRYGRGGSEQHKARYLTGIREAMDKARGAVPAWVIPLPEIADHIPARPNLFDVVIVDEASQVPLESLFLLWLAPRIVVVGDEEQCQPRASTKVDLGTAYEILDRHLPALDTAERNLLGPNANLYELMAARAGQTIRLKEHFRSMPEIIGWSSARFYQNRLIPLRQFGADRLEPLKVVHVPDAEEKYRDSALRNEVEAVAIIDQVEKLITDPGNRDRTIGIVVMQDCYQTKLIDSELRKRISTADLEHHKIRVGTPPDFQGDQRHIILLSLVATKKRTTLRAPTYKRSYNVAASRARDQLWLFTSMDMSTLDPTDMRHLLYQHMRTSMAHSSPNSALDHVSPNDLVDPFESLTQQRIFLELRARGYLALPQYEIDAKRIDFLVIGEHGRLAVECDGPSVATTAEEIGQDINRQRELRRCDWRIVRIRESEFILDPDAALQPLWHELHERGIEPRIATKEPA